MNPTELLKQHPECYAEVVEIGVQKEKQRVAKLMNWASADPACKDIVAEAIVSGKSGEDVTPQLMAAIKNAPENPPVVATAAAAVGVVVSKAQSGENVTYAALGHCLVRVGAAVNSGAALTIGASGFLTTYAQVASGALPVSSPVGRALAQAGSGDLVPAAVNFYTGGLAV